MMRFFVSTILFSTILALTACDSSVVFEENLRIKNAAWQRQDKAFFQVEITDSLAAYEWVLNFRHGGDYPYKNIYLFIESTSPSGLVAKDTAQMIRATNKGRWMGKGIGDIFDYQFQFKKGKIFPEKGNYYIEIEQAMRDKTLENVTDIGIAIKKVKL